jgi:hypothetical protein
MLVIAPAPTPMSIWSSFWGSAFRARANPVKEAIKVRVIARMADI